MKLMMTHSKVLNIIEIYSFVDSKLMIKLANTKAVKACLMCGGLIGFSSNIRIEIKYIAKPHTIHKPPIKARITIGKSL